LACSGLYKCLLALWKAQALKHCEVNGRDLDGTLYNAHQICMHAFEPLL